MKSLKRIVLIGCALIGVAGLSSCSYEETTRFSYTVEGLTMMAVPSASAPDATEAKAETMFMDFMNRFHLLEPMTYVNEAGTHSAARELNDEEAAIVFWDRWRLYNFELPELRGSYREAGYEAVRAEFCYALTRDDGAVLLWERAYFDWPNLN